MSKYRNHWLRQWEIVWDCLKRDSYTRSGQVLSARDTLTWSESLVLLGILVTDLTLKHSTNIAAVIQWVKLLAKLDVYTVSKSLKQLDQCLIKALVEPMPDTHPDDCFATFKQWYLSCSEAAACKRCLSLFRDDVREFFWTWDVGIFRQLHQIFAFMSRVSLRDIDNSEVVDKFVDLDRSLPDADDELTSSLSIIAEEWLHDFAVTSLPGHGPGSTADAGRTSLIEKYLHIGCDEELRSVVARSGYDPMDFVLGVPPTWRRVAKLQVVPKSALTGRTICMEPVTLQFYQQMVRRSLYRYIGSHPQLGHHIHLTDQSVNRNAACEGSKFGRLATIDMSSASDSVSWSLVEKVFSRTPLFPWLSATRSLQVELPSGETIETKKFAPMGSALCFPTMCLVFAAICEYAVRTTDRKSVV